MPRKKVKKNGGDAPSKKRGKRFGTRADKGIALSLGTDFSGMDAVATVLSKSMGVSVSHKFASEIAPAPRKLLKCHFDVEKLYCNAAKRDVTEMPRVDLYAAGAPCVSFSALGKRKGTRDKRGKLFNESMKWSFANYKQVIGAFKGLYKVDVI